MRRAALLGVTAVLLAAPASAATFTVTITNTATSGPAWSTGLLTLSPLISIGLTPQPGSNQYATYTFANSQCNVSDSFCNGTCSDNGNATVLAQRWGLTLGTNAWVVPALAINGGTTTITFDAPVGSSLSYIAWVNDTSVFDDFVAMHVVGSPSQLSVPLFSGSTPLENLEFDISGYDSNSTDPNDGSGNTCSPACPTAATGCYVALGNASYGAAGDLPSPPTPAARNVTAVSGTGQVRLAWSNVAPHTGVIVARRTNSSITWSPSNGTTYTAGQQVANQGGNPTVIVYADAAGTAATAFTNTGLTNGTRYFYKVYPYAGARVYGSGNVPSSAGIFAEPTTKTGSSPLWCYSVGLPTLQQPTTQLNTSVFTASNGGSLTASSTNPGSSDGFERWRPAQLSGAVQSRPTLVPLTGRAGNYLLTGDQAGYGYVVSASDGSLVWRSSGGAGTNGALGDAVQGQPVVQLYQYANPAFQAAHPNRDLVFFATRNNSTSNNKVYAVSSVTGAVVWSYAPNNLDIVNGGMAVDYANNRLWVAARSANNTRTSLRVLSTLNGAEVASLPLGDLDYGVNLRFVGGVATEAVTINNDAGTVYGVNLSTMNVAWRGTLGTTGTIPTNWAFPLNTGFIATLSGGDAGTGVVRRYDVRTDGGIATLWSANAPGANGVTVDYTNQRVFVGGTGSTLRQLSLEDGGLQKTLVMPGTTTTFGMPTLDTAAGRLHVGTLDGRLCAFPVPLP